MCTLCTLERFGGLPGLSGLGRVFSSKDTDLCTRAAGLKRLGFAIHSGRIDQYSRFLPYIVEKVVRF